MKKNLLISFLFLFCALAVNAQTNLIDNNRMKITPQENQALRHTIDSLNKQLPVSLNSSIDMMKFVYENNQVTMVYAVDENAINIVELKKNPETLKQSLRQTIANSSAFKPLIVLLLENKSSLGVLYHSKSSTNAVSVDLSYEDLEEIAQLQATNNLDYEARLQAQIRVTNLSLPRMVDEITCCDRAAIEGKNVVYYETVIESSEFSLADLKTGKQKKAFVDIIKAGTIVNVKTDPLQSNLFKLIVATGRGLKYRYTGNTTGKTIDVVFSNKEMKQLLLSF